jgi:hypothetical protein
VTTGSEHYREAERLLAEAALILRNADDTCPEADRTIAEAQVHATLALAAAQAMRVSHEDVDPATWQGWRDAVDDRIGHPELIEEIRRTHDAAESDGAKVTGEHQSYGASFAAELADAEARGSHLPPGQAWHQIHPERYERIVDGEPWALDDCAEDELGPEDPGPGWYLYGPGPFMEGRHVSADSDTVPIATADAVITKARAGGVAS